MAISERDIQEQMGNTIPSLQEMASIALLTKFGKEPGFFKSIKEKAPHLIQNMLPIWQDRSAKLLDCAGFGRRLEAETIFKKYPGLLLWRGQLTDITKKTYEDITAFEYAVRAKDFYFAKRVVDFIVTYQGKDKNVIVEDLLEQFDRSFSEERLVSVTGFIEACKTWRAAWPDRTWAERDQHFIQDVGESQAHFEAHILHEYCNLTRLFDPTPEFNEADLAENFSFFDRDFNTISLLSARPGVTGNFVLERGQGIFARALPGARFAKSFMAPVIIDCAAVDALDQKRTSDLLLLKGRLVSIQMAVDSQVAEPVSAESSFFPS